MMEEDELQEEKPQENKQIEDVPLEDKPQKDKPQEDVPIEDKQQEKKNHNVADSPEDRNLSLCSEKDSKLDSTYKLWLKDHKNEVITGVISALISGAVVAMLSFWFAGWGEQRDLDTATKQRLYVAGFEAKINLETAEEIKEIIDNKGDANHVRINVRRLDSTSAVAALKDANLLSILSGEKVILLKSYLDDIQTFNQSLQTYQQTLEIEDYKNTNTVNGMRKLVLYNADAVCDKVCLLQEKVNEYFGDKLYDIQEIEKMRKRLKDIKAK